MTPLVVWIDIIANAGVCILCVATTSVLISTWYKIDNQNYPKWALVAVGMLYFGYCVRRILNIVEITQPITMWLVTWDVISVGSTTIGMVGQIALARWARVRTLTLNSANTHDKGVIEEKDIEILRLNSMVKLLQTSQIISNQEVTNQTVTNQTVENKK